MRSLARCFDPESIVVIGGKEAGRVVEQCRKFGFVGQIAAVNPRRESLAGIPCLSSVDELEFTPDAAFVAVPADLSIDIIAQLSAIDCGGVVCYASGFGETGNQDRHQRLIEAAGNMPVIGPNCYGFLNTRSGAALWPDQHGLARLSDSADDGPGGVAIFSSSGNVSINLTMQQRSLPVALLVTVGNQAMVGIEECIEAVVDDPAISVIGLHIEGLRSFALFVELATRAISRGKTIVVLKTGRTEMGARITMSHTATLAGTAAVYDALFQRLGVAIVHDIDTFLETLKLASVHGQMTGSAIASMSCSGGEASLIADLAEDTRLSFRPMTHHHQASVRQTLNEYVTVANPLDYHTFIWGDRDRLGNTFRAMLEGQFDLTLLILDYPCVNDCDMQEWVEAGEVFAEACAATGQRGAVVSLLPENLPEPVRDALMAAGVAPLQGLRQSVAAISALVDAFILRGAKPEIVPLTLPATMEETTSLSEYAAKRALQEQGLAIPEGALVTDQAEALEVAHGIGYPVVLKASGEALLHKTESNGVVTSVVDDAVLDQQVKRLMQIGDAVLVEKMFTEGVAELLIGVVADPQLGHYLVIGSGGVLTELLQDRQLLLLPSDQTAIRSALGRLRCAPLLEGYRGRGEADIDAVVAAIQAVIRFVESNAHRLVEVEINPLIAGVRGAGAVAADALIVERTPN